MRVTIIGSTQYRDKILRHMEGLEKAGHSVSIPAFDDYSGYDELQICEHNRQIIEEADEIHLIWDGRSLGAWGDFCMAFALKKVVRIVYLEPKSIRAVIEKYAAKFI